MRNGAGSLPRPGLLAGALVAAGAALIAARAVAEEPRVAVALPALLALVLAARRVPAAFALGLVVVAGAGGTLFAYTGVNAQAPADAFLAALWGAALWRILVDGVPPPPRHVWLAILLLGGFLAASAVAVLTAPAILDGVRSLRGSQWLMTATLLPLVSPWSRETQRTIMRGVLVIGAAVAAYACVRYALGKPSSDELTAAYQADPGLRNTQGDLPVIGSFASAKTLGLWCAVVLPLGLAAALFERGAWRIVAAAACVTSAVALFGSQTRTALVGAAVGLALVAVTTAMTRVEGGLRLGRTVMAVAIAGVVLAGGYAIVADGDTAVESRFAELRDPSDVASYRVRRERWAAALGGIGDRPLGKGLATASIAAKASGRSLQNLDSSYVVIATEQGVVVVLFLLAVAGLLGRLAASAVRSADSEAQGWAIGAAGALAGFAVLMYATIAAEQLPAVMVWLVCGVAAAALTAEGVQRPPSAAR